MQNTASVGVGVFDQITVILVAFKSRVSVNNVTIAAVLVQMLGQVAYAVSTVGVAFLAAYGIDYVAC